MRLPPFSSIPQLLIAKTGWQRLAKREKLMVGGLSAVVFALLFFHFIFSPLLDSRSRLQNSLLKKQTELQEMHKLQKEYQLLQLKSGDIQDRIAKREKNFTLFSFIEQQATTAKIKEKIKYLKPSKVEGKGPLLESRVDMKLEEISLESLVRFLKGVESEKNAVFISRISIQEHGKEEGSLNAVIQVITFRTGTT